VNPRSLALLSDAYTSPMLLNTLVREGIPVAAKGPLREELARFCPGLRLASREEALDIIAQPDSLILANSEGLLPCLLSESADSSRKVALRLLKDKSVLRKPTVAGGPGSATGSRVVEACQLKEAKLPSDGSFVIKPSAGLQGIGIRRVGASGLAAVAEEILEEVSRGSERFGPDLLSTDRFLIEDYVRGEEFACDAYLSQSGEPVILGAYGHPHMNDDDLGDVLYYTSSELMNKMQSRMSDFLRGLNERPGIRGLPLHAEFRRQGRDLIPIEVNPLRFGDFGLPDLTFFAFGVNCYRHYFLQQAPQWDRILLQAEKDIFFRVLSRLPDGAGAAAGKKIEHEEFADTFEHLTGYCRLDPLRYPAFSIAFAREVKMKAVTKYLSVDFRDFLS
jgi:hypothetical protein